MAWKKTTLYQGGARTLTVSIKRQSNGQPYDLTDATAIVAEFCGADGTVKSLSLAGGTIEVVSPSGAGMANLIMSEAFIESLKVANNQDFDVIVTIGGNPTVIRFHEALSVEAGIDGC